MIRFSSFDFPCISATPTMSLSSYFESIVLSKNSSASNRGKDSYVSYLSSFVALFSIFLSAWEKAKPPLLSKGLRLSGMLIMDMENMNIHAMAMIDLNLNRITSSMDLLRRKSKTTVSAPNSTKGALWRRNVHPDIETLNTVLRSCSSTVAGNMNLMVCRTTAANKRDITKRRRLLFQKFDS